MASPINLSVSNAPLTAHLLEKVMENREPTLARGCLIEELVNLLGRAIITTHPKALSLLEGRLRQISCKNGLEPMGKSEQVFYNLSQHLVDRQGQMNEWCLNELHTIDFAETAEDKENFEALYVNFTFERVGKLLDTYRYVQAAEEILRMKSFAPLKLFLEKKVNQKQLRSLARELSKQDHFRGRKIVKNHFPPFETKADRLAFGPLKWKEYFGEIATDCPLPKDIEDILASPCPFWSGKRVDQTHVLVFIPGQVDGKPFTLNCLRELMPSSRSGYKTQYEYVDATVMQTHGGHTPARGAYWVLMTKDIIPGSRGKSFAEQCSLIANHKEYRAPTLIEAVTCLLVEYTTTGHRLYSKHPCTYTHCQELTLGYQAVVGGFGVQGLSLNHNVNVCGNYGLGVVREI